MYSKSQGIADHLRYFNEKCPTKELTIEPPTTYSTNDLKLWVGYGVSLQGHFMTRYIQHFPQPLLDDLVKGRWLPMVGAGFSRNAVVPKGRQMPVWSDLGDTLGAELGDYSPSSPLDAISAYEHEFERPKLVERLSELLLVHEALPGEAHKAFCSIPFDLVCTTNFDFLLEREYEQLSRPCTPLVNEDQLSINLKGTGPSLLKLHADIHHPTRMVLTESDYDCFLNSYPLIATFLANLLITRTAVLIGYSLDDPDFRQVWQVVADRLGRSRRAAYTIGVGVKPTVVSRFERRGVRVINLPGSASRYSEVLAAAFTELGDHWREQVIRPSQVKEEYSLHELSLPPEGLSRLCFFAVPLTTLSFYKEQVFPIAREQGFVPVSADDVVSPGDTILATIEALIQRAQLFVVDASSPNTLFELGLARAHMDASRILVVAPSLGELPFDLREVQTLLRPDVAATESEEFVGAVVRWFATAADRFAPRLAEEPRRLLHAREYRAAVIASISLLEVFLRKRPDMPSSVSGRRVTFPALLEFAQREGVLGEVPAKRIVEWSRIRNEVVHSQRSVRKSEAESIVRGVLQIVGVK